MTTYDPARQSSADVATEAEVDSKIAAHAGFPNVHHPQLHQATHRAGQPDAISLDASQVATGRFGVARMPDGVSGQVLTGQGVGIDPVYAEPVVPANSVNVMVEAIIYG